jgi:hypothetical protein
LRAVPAEDREPCSPPVCPNTSNGVPGVKIHVTGFAVARDFENSDCKRIRCK